MSLASPSASSELEKNGLHDDVEEKANGSPEECEAGVALESRNDPIGGLRPAEGVKQGLNQRHLQMLALAGAIGTGIFLSTGQALANAGPVGLLIGYTFVSTIVVGVVFSVAEMAALAPTSGSYVRHAKMFAAEELGFSIGWNLVFGSCISIPSELVGCWILVGYWSDVNAAIIIVTMGVGIIVTNVITIRIYGEVEFAFAILKIILVVGLVIFGIAIDAGAGPLADGYIGFRYWRNPGPFAEYIVTGAAGKMAGFWYTLIGSCYAFAGTESVSFAGAETRQPRQNIPKAARRVFFRIGALYILAIFVVSLIVPSDDPGLQDDSGTALQSPFVVAASRAGVTSVASLINAIVLTSAWSSANQNMLTASRSLLALALDGNAPRILLRVNRFGVPWIAILTVTAFFPLAFLTLSSDGSNVFWWFVSLVSASTLWQWIAICVTYLRLFYGMARQGIERSELPYKATLQPYLAWWSLFWASIILITGGFTNFIPGNFSAQDFVSAYFFPLFNIVVIVTFKIYKRTRIVPLDQVPVRPWLEEIRRFPEEPLKKAKGWRRVVTVLWA